jgi:AraC-like DNA-binding protein
MPPAKELIHEDKIISYRGKVVFHKILVSAPKRELKPFQNNEACFMFVNQGEFSIRTPDQLISFNEDKGLLAKCFNFFIETSKSQRQSNQKLEFLGVFLFPSHVEDILSFDLSASKQQVNYNIKQLQIDRLLNSYRDSVNILIDNPELADEVMIETKLKEFVLLISKSQNMSPIDFMAAMFKTNSTEFKATINNNLYSNLSVAEFARLCGMSTSSFKRKFAKEYVDSPKKYFAKMKLIKAANHLSDRSKRISDIAYDCGYETISTFNRTFKSHYGVSPSDYRLSQIA